MGAWGPGIFDDDEALDVRADYRGFLADAQSDAGATDAIAKACQANFDQLGATTAFWLALAVTQWKLGRLDPRVKAAALRIIDDGIDLAKWNEGTDLRKRAAALRKARQTIASPLPPAKTMPMPLPVQLPGWEFGEVIGYRVPNGRLALLHMLNYHAWSTLKVKAPVVSVLNWTEERMPEPREVETLTFINQRGEAAGTHHLYCLAAPRGKPLQPVSFQHLGLSKPVTRAEATSGIYGIREDLGGTLDAVLESVLSPYWRDPSRPAHVPKAPPI